MAIKAKKNPHTEVESIDIEPVVRELEAVKKLLVLLLAKLGSDSAEIATALKLESSTVRRWIAFRQIRKLPTAGDKNSE